MTPCNRDVPVAIVTGAASGIGRATAGCLDRNGIRVYMVDKAGDGLAQTAGVMTQGAEPREGSVTDRDFLDGLVAEIIDREGRIDHLVNAAGVLDGYRSLTETSSELLERVLAVNLLGAFELCRRVVPAMVERGYGKIVNITSWAASVGDAGGLSYTVSKHGLLGLTRSIATVYGPRGIRTNAVCPGVITTGLRKSTARELEGESLDMRRGLGALGSDALSKLVPLGEAGSPQDVAEAVAFLCSPAGDYIHGSTMTVDGGFLARGSMPEVFGTAIA